MVAFAVENGRSAAAAVRSCRVGFVARRRCCCWWYCKRRVHVLTRELKNILTRKECVMDSVAICKYLLPYLYESIIDT